MSSSVGADRFAELEKYDQHLCDGNSHTEDYHVQVIRYLVVPCAKNSGVKQGLLHLATFGLSTLYQVLKYGVEGFGHIVEGEHAAIVIWYKCQRCHAVFPEIHDFSDKGYRRRYAKNFYETITTLSLNVHFVIYY